MYSTYSQRSKTEDDYDGDQEKEVEEGPIDEDEGYNSEGDDKFNYVMTYRKEYKNGQKLPEIIKLDDPYPGEPRFMKKRTFPAVLRFNKTNRDNNPKKYMLSELMLYKPVTAEIDQDDVEQLYVEVHNDKRKVDIVKSQVMEHLEGVEEGRYYVEQIKKELDLTEIGNTLDPTLQQENAASRI